MRSRIFFLLILLGTFATSLRATTIVMPTDEQLIAKSRLIVSGFVVSSRAVERHGGIWTETVLDVDRVLKGRHADEVVILEMGGTLGKHVSVVFGAPDYVPGEHVLAFLSRARNGSYQTTDLFVGKFSEKRTRSGLRVWNRPDQMPRTQLLDRDFQPIAATKVQRDASRFEQYVTDRATGRQGERNYGVRETVNMVESDFTLISEPTIYRWFAFEQGRSANWLSSGSQPGYSNGGINEVSSAMNAWNSAPGVNIRYTYGGPSSAAPGGLASPNGINEVMFNDPKGEITPGYTVSSGGVVGRGGFNNVRNGGTWSSPFTADPAHPSRSFANSGDIVEGNLVIATGVSPSTGISSGVLASIIAHEFGHTLGIGHSADSSALMYGTVARSGATLGADDQLSASWLYPSGAGATPPPPAPAPAPTPTVPAAPSNLNASVLNPPQVQLSWSINATNATVQTVYVAPAGSGFTNVGDIPSDARSLALTGFTAGQTYQIRLTARNASGESQPSNTVNVTLPAAAAALQASFNVSTSSGVAGVTQFNFSDQSTGSVASRLWNFGDGTASTLANPTKVYATAGTFTVTLTVSNGSAQSSVNLLVNVTAPATPPPAVLSTPSFTYTVNGQQVTFVEQSSGASNWSWNFGDGTGSSARNPLKTYASSGNYQVTLTISNGVSTSSTAQRITIARGRGRTSRRR